MTNELRSKCDYTVQLVMLLAHGPEVPVESPDGCRGLNVSQLSVFTHFSGSRNSIKSLHPGLPSILGWVSTGQ